jgi:hypothetical protein
MSRVIRNATLSLFVLVGVVVSNALVDGMVTCQRADDCWCKTRLGRHLRWWVPSRTHSLRSR